MEDEVRELKRSYAFCSTNLFPLFTVVMAKAFSIVAKLPTNVAKKHRVT